MNVFEFTNKTVEYLTRTTQLAFPTFVRIVKGIAVNTGSFLFLYIWE